MTTRIAASGSIYRLYQKLIGLRKKHPGLSVGSYRPIVCEENFLLYGRDHENEQLLVALNLSGDPVAASAPAYRGRVLFSAHGDRHGEAFQGQVDLRPNEGIIIELTSEL
jgi:alpha-glucosidase